MNITYKCFPSVLLVLSVLAIFSISEAAGSQVQHHLQVQLYPSENRLEGYDEITIARPQSEKLSFHLSARAEILDVRINNKSRQYSFRNNLLQIPLLAADSRDNVQVTISYTGIFDDPVPKRPVNMDNPGFGVNASITEQGSFLLAGALWYPELDADRISYQLRVNAPAGMIAVSAGRSLGHKTEKGRTVSVWEVNRPVNGLALSVAPYIVDQKKVGPVVVATYFLERNRHLAASYLEASARYLTLYSDLFGPYPFQKFAVVENFFPTGYGFPSYTLLGGTVLRLPFIIHTSLGHEIAHCWWGNGVYVDYESGNWSEALTTYTADYLYKKFKSETAAKNYRRQILRNYSTLVNTNNDFPIDHFTSRNSPLTKTIGYDKGAMVFHMLQKLIGENAFQEALRDVYRERLFRKTSWRDLQIAFEKHSQRSLQAFFEQWVHRKGAPQLSFEGIASKKVSGGHVVSGRVIQAEPYFDINLRLRLETEDNVIEQPLWVTAEMTAFEFNTSNPPHKLTADPEYDIMRRLSPSEIPPSVNSLKNSGSTLIVLTGKKDPEIKKAADFMVVSLGLKNFKFSEVDTLTPAALAENDLIVVGPPGETAFFNQIPDIAGFSEKYFTVNGNVYDRPGDAFFGVMPNPDARDRVIALFWPLSAKFAERVAAKTTHYGKYSYLSFRNGNNTEKGFWPVTQSPVVFEWN